MFKKIFILIFLIYSFVFALAANADSSFVIRKTDLTESQDILTIDGDNGDKFPEYAVIQLENPARIVIDIPNTILLGKKRSFDLAQEGVKNIKISQFSVNPDIVRMVLTADSAENFKKIKIEKNYNDLTIKLSELIMRSVFVSSSSDNADKKEEKVETVSLKLTKKEVCEEKTTEEENKPSIIFNSVKYGKNYISLSGKGALTIKEPFILDNPVRMVFDFPNAIINKETAQQYALANKDTIKFGQFDKTTVRAVLQSDNPKDYRSIVSPDLQTIVIGLKDKTDFPEIPQLKNQGIISDVSINKQGDSLVSMTFKSNQPIIHNIENLHNPERINLELLNLKSPDKTFIQKLSEQFKKLEVNANGTNGTSLIFNVGKDIEFDSQLSLDGKVLSVIFKNFDLTPFTPYILKPASSRRIVIDAGHGGLDPGAQRAGISEKDINIDVAKRIKKLLLQQGMQVVMTREGDETLSLKDRTNITNQAKADVFVSVHVNACNSPSIKGLETHWYTRQSYSLAKAVHKEINQKINSPDRGIINSMFYVIHHTEVPAVLVEIGFISNDNERYQMITEERKNATAKAIVSGIMNYLNVK